MSQIASAQGLKFVGNVEAGKTLAKGCQHPGREAGNDDSVQGVVFLKQISHPLRKLERFIRFELQPDPGFIVTLLQQILKQQQPFRCVSVAVQRVQ